MRIVLSSNRCHLAAPGRGNRATEEQREPARGLGAQHYIGLVSDQNTPGCIRTRPLWVL